MKSLRVTIRIPALILASVFCYLLWLIGKLLTWRFKRARWRWYRFVFGSWGRLVAAIIGMRIHVRGSPPQPPFFLVSNHLSYVDIVLFAARLGCVFISRADLANWPGIGWMARGIGTIFIEREKIHAIPQVVGRINEALAEGAGVALFPEGTSGAGDKVLPFYPSLLEPAARANYPVSFASIGYSTSPGEPPAYLAVSWWREVSFGAHLIDLLKLSRFDAFITFGSHAIRADDRKTLAKSLWSAINDQFTPMVDSELLSNEKE